MSLERRRRILHAIKIGEISAVTKPAQQGAVMVIMKRDSTQQEDIDMEHISKSDIDEGFDAIVNIFRRDGETFSKAYSRALEEHPFLYVTYKAANQRPEIPLQKKVEAVAALDDSIDAIVKHEQRQGETFAKAYSRVLQERPELYEAYVGRRREVGV